MLFKEAVEPFLIYSRVERNHAKETQIKLRDCFRAWLLPHMGEVPLERLTQLDVLKLREAMADGQIGGARQYSVLMALKTFLKFCRTSLEINCLNPDAIRLPKRPNPRVEFLTNAEVNAVRQTIDTSKLVGLRLRALFEVLLATGMRISESLQLNRDSVDPETLEADIVGKGNRPRTVFLNSECMKWVDRYLAARSDAIPALFVTTGSPPRRLLRGDIPEFFRAVAKQAGVQKHFTPHLLRHTFCTNLRNNGADISLIKDLAGHSDIDTTARYYLSSDKSTLRTAVRKYLDYSLPPQLNP